VQRAGRADEDALATVDAGGDVQALLNAVPTMDLEPRWTKSMAETPWTSSQTRTHLPQRMHFSGRAGCSGRDVLLALVLLAPEPARAHAVLLGEIGELAIAAADAVETVIRMVGEQEFDDSPPRRITAGELLLIFIPSATGNEQDAPGCRTFDLDTHIRQAPDGARSPCSTGSAL